MGSRSLGTVSQVRESGREKESVETQNNPNPVDASQYALEHIEEWLNLLMEKRDWSRKKAVGYISCFKVFADMRAADEPQDVGWFRDNIDTLVRRYNSGKGGTSDRTAQTYRGKALNAIEWFLEVKTTGVLPAKALKSRGSNGSASKKTPKKTPEKTGVEEPPVVIREFAGSESLRTFPLSGGDEIRFALPDEGLGSEDVHRFFCHLMTLTKDFDPRRLFPGLPPVREAVEDRVPDLG